MTILDKISQELKKIHPAKTSPELTRLLNDLKEEQKQEHESYLQRRTKPKPTNLTQSQGKKLEIEI